MCQFFNPRCWLGVQLLADRHPGKRSLLTMDLLRLAQVPPVSRRDFLKWSSLAFLGIYLPDFHPKPQMDPIMHGRVLENVITVYDQPSYGGNFVKVYWRDLVLPINAVTVGTEPAHNRVWYHVNGEGYVHSGTVQPVNISPAAPAEVIPEGGILAEVSVPFTEARKKADPTSRLAYRFYYGTAHWVLGMETGTDEAAWYRIYDDKYKLEYFVDARHLRLIKPDELEPLSNSIPMEEKRLEVRLADQVIIAWEAGKPVFMSRIASGARFSNGDFTTPAGQYMTFHKRPYRHMAAGDFAAANSYDLPGVPWVCYFTPEGISIHGTFWHNDFGKPRSHGCINLPVEAARWVYLWTLPTVPGAEQYAYKSFGTRLDIQ